MAASSDPRDTYKSILLLQGLPPNYSRLRSGGLAKILAPCGVSDNNVGGLFGKSNIFGETTIPTSFQTTQFSPPLPYGTGVVWTAVLSGTASTVSFSIENISSQPPVVHDNQRWNPTTNVFESAPGNVGIMIDMSVTQWTGLDLENAINASSSLVKVTTPDPQHALPLSATDLSGIGLMVAFQDRSAVDQARDSMMFDTASGKYLTIGGANYGIPRPPQSPFDDELFRKVAQILAWLPKTPYLVTYRLAEAIFGTQQAVQDQFGVTWQIYEVNPNEIIFECPLELISGTIETATYLHGYSGNTNAVVGPTNTITGNGPDARLSVLNGNLNGRAIYVFHTGVWNTYSITGAAYNPFTSVNTFTLNLATVPTGNNYPFFIDIPGTSSYPGDFMLADATTPAGLPTHPASASLVYLFGKARLDIFEFYMNDFVRAAGVSLRSEVL